jgi:hypothetical protein
LSYELPYFKLYLDSCQSFIFESTWFLPVLYLLSKKFFGIPRRRHYLWGLKCIIVRVKICFRIKTAFIGCLVIVLAGCGILSPSPTPTYRPILASQEMRMTVLARVLSSTPALDFITLPAATLQPAISTALTMAAQSKGITPPDGTLEPPTSSAPIPHQPCAYTWTSKLLPEESVKFQQALTEAGLINVQGAVEGFGEYCLDTQKNNSSFGVMQTDFRLITFVADSSDFESMGRTLHSCLEVILHFPPGAFPGTFPGHIGIDYQGTSPSYRLWFPLTKGKQALEKGLDGAELIEALQDAS